MNPRGGGPPKRNVCRYFAASGSCYYGDSCQFHHILDSTLHPGTMLGPATIAPCPPLRSQSAGVSMMRPPGHRGAAMHINLPPSVDRPKRADSLPFQGRSSSRRSTSYKSSLSQHVSNPPKYRVGVTLSRERNHLQGQCNTKLHPPPQKRDGETGSGGEKRGKESRGTGTIGNPLLEDNDRVTAMHPPPVSKQGKICATSSTAAQSQVQSGGTTYFYSGQQPSFSPDYTVYTKPPSHLTRKTRNMPGYFVSEDLKQDLYQQQLACLTLPSSEEACPKEVDSYHSLCPLEPVDATTPDKEAKRTFGHSSTCYRAISQKDGFYYCLRRIHGFRLTSAKAVQELDKWKKIEHVNLVSLREMFTTKAFGDNSVVFVYDYHPAAKTMQEKHLKHSKRTSPLPEDLVWDYIVQLASVLRLVHQNQLALRCLDPTKILVNSHQRLRVNCAGIVDILTFDVSSPLNPSIHQQSDLFLLGQLLLCVGLQSIEAGGPSNLHRSMDVIAKNYSPDLTHLLQYLLESGSKGSHNILDVISMIGGRVFLTMERVFQREDILELELSREVQNGRLFRILAKLGTINERPEFAGDEQWSETGDRYLLKLFRDYLFHQVLPSGAPWVNLAHVVQTLNKVDAGIFENVALHSRDEQSVLVVSYADLKACLEKTFSEVLLSSGTTAPPRTESLNNWALNGNSHSFYMYGNSVS